MDTHYSSIQLPETASTQDEARRRFDGNPILVVTEHQTQGRGRSGAEWLSATRACAASLTLQPGWPQAAFPGLSVIAAVAVSEAFDLGLKWPNDLMADGMKVGGILVEASGEVATIGVGINLWWDSNPEGWGALYASDPGPEAVQAVAEEWATRFLKMVDLGPGALPIERYRARCLSIGREVTWEPDGAGVVTGIDPDGGLVVDTATGTRVLRSGEVRQIR